MSPREPTVLLLCPGIAMLSVPEPTGSCSGQDGSDLVTLPHHLLGQGSSRLLVGPRVHMHGFYHLLIGLGRLPLGLRLCGKVSDDGVPGRQQRSCLCSLQLLGGGGRKPW